MISLAVLSDYRFWQTFAVLTYSNGNLMWHMC